MNSHNGESLKSPSVESPSPEVVFRNAWKGVFSDGSTHENARVTPPGDHFFEKVASFWRMLQEESKIQNLTTQTELVDFVATHFLDACFLLKWGKLGRKVADLGAGGGVPSLICALADDRHWTLVESESSKAEFLIRAIQKLQLGDRVKVYSGRIEAWAQEQSNQRVGEFGAVDTLFARALGPVSRILGWLGSCSTWNNLVLMKGPGWIREWSEYSARKSAVKPVELVDDYSYVSQFGDREPRNLRIVQLRNLSKKGRHPKS